MRKVLCSIVVLSCLASAAAAAVPGTISYQGRLTDDAGQPITDSREIKFKIYGSSSGDDSLWSSGFQTIDVINGLFKYDLGSNVPLPAGLFSGDDSRYLGITVETDAEIVPRTRFIAVPYSHHAASADTADYAYSSPGGMSNGWVDAGSMIRLVDSTDHVGIGTSTPNEPLVVGKDLGEQNGDYIVIGNDTPDRLSGLKMGEDENNYGVYMWGNNDNGLSWRTKENGAWKPGMYFMNGNLGIGGTGAYNPSEPLVVGKDVGSFNGNRIVVGAAAPHDYAGVIMGEDSDNRAFLTWSVDGNYFDIGIEDEGTQWSQMIKLQDGETKIGVGSGNSSVLLPNDAVSSAEILNEAGMQTVDRYSRIDIQANWTSIVSATLDFPSSGYVIILATAELWIQKWQDENPPDLEFGITNHTGVAPHAYRKNASDAITSEPFFEWYYDPVTIHEVFSVSAGTESFEFLAIVTNGSCCDNEPVFDARMTVIYVPTSYAFSKASSADATDQPDMMAQPQVFTNSSSSDDVVSSGEPMADPIASLRAEFEEELQALRDEIAELKNKR